MEEKVCINCGKTDDKVPLVHLTFKGEEKYICAQCFPTLIHKIHLLADKLPGEESPMPQVRAGQLDYNWLSLTNAQVGIIRPGSMR